jgi:NAD-dependent dihydropyrimidine dehydrogenase PreA subunit/nitroreductase
VVTIEQDKCTGCGICVRICHEHCMSVRTGKIHIDYASCSTCTQCIAACPEQALAWDRVPPTVFNAKRLPTPEQMDELLKQRRTVRHFGADPISRSVLETLASYGAYAPTHSHNFGMLIIDDNSIMDIMDKALTKYSSMIYRLLFKPKVIYWLMKLFAPSMKEEYFRGKTKLEAAVKRGSVLRSRPSAFIAVIGSKHTPLNLESAQYVVYNMTLVAQAKGLGCRNLVGNQAILNRNTSFRKAVNLNRADRIFGLVGIGHPSVEYRNKVEGRRLPVQWNGAPNSGRD